MRRDGVLGDESEREFSVKKDMFGGQVKDVFGVGRRDRDIPVFDLDIVEGGVGKGVLLCLGVEKCGEEDSGDFGDFVGGFDWDFDEGVEGVERVEREEKENGLPLAFSLSLSSMFCDFAAAAAFLGFRPLLPLGALALA